MVNIESSIGKFLTLSYRQPELLDDHPLKLRMENFLDLVVARIEKKGLETPNLFMQEDLFLLRFEAIDFLKTHVDLWHYFESKILDEISNKYFFEGANKELAGLYSDTLEVYFNIFEALSSNFDLDGSLQSLDIDKLPTLSSLKNLYKVQPTPDLAFSIKWIESSLNYEYYLIVAELFFHGYMSLNEEMEAQLRTQLRTTIEDFAAVSSISAIWSPAIDDERPLIRNIKIKTAFFRSQLVQLEPYDLDSLRGTILS